MQGINTGVSQEKENYSCDTPLIFLPDIPERVHRTFRPAVRQAQVKCQIRNSKLKKINTGEKTSEKRLDLLK